MVKKKKYRGHFCKVCRKILPNEKFSGKGHAAHICKKCKEIKGAKVRRDFHRLHLQCTFIRQPFA